MAPGRCAARCAPGWTPGRSPGSSPAPARPARSCARTPTRAIDVAAELAGVGVCRTVRVAHGPVPGARVVDQHEPPGPPPLAAGARLMARADAAPRTWSTWSRSPRTCPATPPGCCSTRCRSASSAATGSASSGSTAAARPRCSTSSPARARPDGGRVSRVGGLRLAAPRPGRRAAAGRPRPRRRAGRLGGRRRARVGGRRRGPRRARRAGHRRPRPLASTACPAARSAGSRWPRRWSATPTWSCSTSRPTTSTSRASAGSPQHLLAPALRGRRRHPRPLVPRRGLHPHLGGRRRAAWRATSAATPTGSTPGPSGPGRPTPPRPAGRTWPARSWPGCAAGRPPARRKPRYRIEAAEALIADVPPPRNTVELLGFATNRLGRTVLELEDATATDRRPDAAGPRHLAARARATGSASSGSTARARRRCCAR